MIQGLQPGLVSGLVSGPDSPPGFAGIVSGAALASAMGHAFAPDWLALGNETTGATDLAGAVDLVNAGSPTHEIADAALGTNTVEFDYNSTDALVAGNDSDLDVGTVSMAHLFVGRLTADAANSKILSGKRSSSAPNAGYELTTFSASRLAWIISAGAGSKAEFSHLDYHPDDDTMFIALGINDHSLPSRGLRLFTDRDTSVGQDAVTDSLVNPQLFAVGRNRTTAAAVHWALGATWIGPSAEGLDKSNVDALKAYLAL